MSARLLARGYPSLARQAALRKTTLRDIHTVPGSAGLLRADSRVLRQTARRWPYGNVYIHGVPAVRHVSFIRNVPKLFLKLARLPAMMGGAALAGVTYIQYQANRMLLLPRSDQSQS